MESAGYPDQGKKTHAMQNNLFRKKLESIFEDAEIRIGGVRAWDVRIKNPQV